MTGLFKVHFLTSNVRTCYFYLNDFDINYFKHYEGAVQIQFGPNREKVTYGGLNSTPASEVPSKCIGIAPLFARNLGLEEGELVLVSVRNVDSIDNLEILPDKEEDYVILLNCKNILETFLLNQASVVAEGQVLPLYVFSNISINVEIGKVSTAAGFGQLKKFTEITVLHPSESTKNSVKFKKEVKLDLNSSKGSKAISEHIFKQFCSVLENRNSMSQIDKLKHADAILKHLVDNNISKSVEYKIQPHFLFSNEFLDKIRNRFIIISNLENATRCTFGPHCVKVLAKVSKVLNDVKDNSEAVDESKKENFLYTFVICLNDNNKNIAICPYDVMKKLNLFVGSRITIEETKLNSKIQLFRCSEKININDGKTESYSKSIAIMKENIKQTIINNFEYNYRINSLILGEPGTGKTVFLEDIVNEYETNFVFCKMIHCKSLRGKKIETLQKLLSDALKECSCQEPSVFVLDDLHALTHVVEDENQFNRLYSDRVVDLICDTLNDFQSKFNISVIASAVNKMQLSSLISRYGPRLFQNVLQISAMNFSERNSALKSLINRNIRISKNSVLDFDKLSGNSNGYTIQDLSDLIEKAVFNCYLRNEANVTLVELNSEDFEKAFLELTPLNLRNVKLKQNPDIKWESVGGMNEAKKTLLEVFSWPVKYPDILESCPLRLQRGVLLFGSPGTGKTLLAGALANKCGLNFISVKGPEILSKYVGASEEGVRNLFFQAEKTKPCLLFFDEFDSLAPKRGHDNTGVTDRVVNQLLTQLDGVEFLNGVWVLAATSRPDLLDPALLRPGRLDKMVFCDIPNQIERKSILEVLSQNLLKSEDVNFLEIAQKSEEYTGADLQAVLYNAQLIAIKEEKNSIEEKLHFKVEQSHLLQALLEVKPSLSQREKDKYKRIYENFFNSRKKHFVENYDGEQKLTFA